MKKIINENKFVVSVFIALLIVISSISVISVSAVPESSVNLIAGKLPVVFGSADSGLFELNDSRVRYKSSGSANMEVGYDSENSGSKASWSDKLALLTDGNADNGQYLRPEKSANKDRLIMVYSFLKSDITSFSIKVEGTTQKSFSVYLSESYERLYSASPVFEVTKNKGTQFSKEFDTAIPAYYLAIVFEAPGYVMDEITLMGSVADTGDNAVSGLTPTMYASARAGEFKYNWYQIHYGTGSSDMKHGYSETDVTGYDEFWNSYTDKLTDGSTDTFLYMKPEVKSGNDRVIIVYSLPDFYDINGFEIKFSSGTKNLSVYLGTNRAKLFDQAAVSNTVNLTGDICNDGFEPIRTKYVGIVFEKPNYNIFELSFYGKKYVPVQKGENVIADTTPIIYASTNKGSFEFNWSQTYYEDATEKMKHGYDNKGNGFKDFWQDHVAKLTDKSTDTELFIRAERTWNRDNVMAVYNFDDSVINGLSIKSSSDKRKVINVYASTNTVDLFDNCVYSFDSTDKVLTDDGSLEIRSKYVAVVFTDPSYSISEIEVNANPYVHPDYGTNLLEGKLPQRFYLSKREYPLKPTSDEIIDIFKTNEALGYATDGDFKTSVNWAPTKAKSKVTKNTRYLVFSYDLGGNCTVDKILIDSGLGGFDIYMSDDYFDLFEKTDNIIYTSNGDKLDQTGEDLDKAANLTPGEIILDFNGVKGRYIGIVVTRAQPVGRESWEIANISEIQVFGTSDNISSRENLIANQAPIMCYRAKNTDFSKSIGQMTSPDDMKRYTDGDMFSGAEIQFPNTSGYINSDYGSLIMIYYLQGSSTIDYFYENSVIYYGIGGIDVFVAEKFADLFNEDSRIFTTNGTDAEDGIYNPEYDLGAKGISGYFDGTKSGRYVAFAFTRISDSISKGWGIFRLSELTLIGSRPELEVLPNTKLTDKSSGASATFEYVNPDEKFDFAAKGINGFKLKYLSAAEYKTGEFNYSLGASGYTNVGDAFRLEFYNSGKKISSSSLSGETVRLNLDLKDTETYFLAEIRDNIPYIIKNAVRLGDVIDLSIEEFDKTYILLKYNKAGNFDVNLSDGSEIINLDPVGGYDDDYDLYEEYEDGYDDDSSIGASGSTGAKKKNGGWKIVVVDDPMQWFWDAYDTFAANIWMPVLCGVTAIISIALMVLSILFYRKRRKQQ